MIACPTLRSRPCFVVGMPTFRATLVFKPLIPTARFNEKDKPFMVNLLSFHLQRYAFLSTYPKSFLILFAKALRSHALKPKKIECQRYQQISKRLLYISAKAKAPI